MRLRAVGLLFLVLRLGACRASPNGTGGAGHLDVQWTGSDRGRIAGPATAEWCRQRRLLEIRTIQGDTGIALAIYPAETVATGGYPVLDPSRADSVLPAAGVALRWLTQNAVQGLQGDSGTVDLERANSGRLSGQVRARARSVVNGERVSVSGTFQDLTVRPAPQKCGDRPEHADEAAESRDTGVH